MDCTILVVSVTEIPELQDFYAMDVEIAVKDNFTERKMSGMSSPADKVPVQVK